MKITIIGAGLLGRLLAWQLLEQDLEQELQIDLIDQDNGDASQSAASVAAAMLAPISEMLDAEPIIYQKGLLGLQTWQSWQQQLAVDFDLRLEGSLLVSHPQDFGNYQQVLRRLKQATMLANNAFQELDLTGLNQLEPGLVARFNQACWLQDEGCLDNHALLAALKQRILQLGANWQTATQIQQINPQDFAADWILDCRGFGAAQQLSNLRGVRGEVIRVFAPEVEITRPIRLLHPRYKLYLAPRKNHQFVIGATQIESADQRQPTVRSSLELLSALYSLHPGFAEAEILQIQAGTRPAFKQNLPRIIQNKNILHINGLFRHGFLLAPLVVQQTLAKLGINYNQNQQEIWPEIFEKQGSSKC